MSFVRQVSGLVCFPFALFAGIYFAEDPKPASKAEGLEGLLSLSLFPGPSLGVHCLCWPMRKDMTEGVKRFLLRLTRQFFI